MGNTRSRCAAALVAISVIAGPALGQGAPITVPGLTAEQVMANLVTRCGMNKGTVEQASSTMVVCTIEGGVGAMILFGTRNGARPVLRYRFIIIPGKDAVSVMPSASMDTMNAFGGSRSEPWAIKSQEIARIAAAARGEFAEAPFKPVQPSGENTPP